MKKHWPIIVILVVSVATHFVFWGYPKETVFDEVHFGKFISGYFTHEYFFDIHPPLGKLIISGIGYLGGFNPGFSFAQIGEKFPDNKYLWLRIGPVIAGTLLPIVIYFLVLALGLSRLASFGAAALVIFENSILAQSLFILLDPFLLLFGFLALFLYFLYRRERRSYLLILAGISGALSVSVKWTGLTFLAIIYLLEFAPLIKSFNWKKFLTLAVFLFLIPFAIYFLIFTVHFKLLSKSGPGDAFMSPNFRKTLIGSPESNDRNVRPLNLVTKFVELNFEMYRANATLSAAHPYSSKWYTWPFMTRPVYYWYQNVGAKDARIYFLGNPITWWLSTLAIVYLILLQLNNFLTKKKLEFLATFIIGAYILNIILFVGIKRVMFLYHYMAAYIFAIIALAYLIDRWQNKKSAFTVLIAASALVFLFFSPLTYGRPLDAKGYNARVWSETWR